MNRSLRLSIGILAAAAAAVLAEIARELHGFVVTRYHVDSKKLAPDTPELKIAFLSDLHNKEYGKGNEKLLRAVRAERPDLILVGGDMLVSKRSVSYEHTVEFLGSLPSIAPVFYANGNHEQRMYEEAEVYGDRYERYQKSLEQTGIHFLRNESQELSWHGSRVRITGLEVPMECYDRWRRRPLSEEELAERIGTADTEALEILLAHSPEYVKEYLRWGADLVLAGHMHGGIVRLPFVGAVLSPQFRPFPRYSGGFYREGQASVAVSRGLGTHTVNLRLWNPAELVVLTVGGAGTAENEQKGRR